MYIFMKVFSRQIYSYGFHNLKVIHDLYSQYLTQTLSTMTFFMGMEGVHTIELLLGLCHDD